MERKSLMVSLVACAIAALPLMLTLQSAVRANRDQINSGGLINSTCRRFGSTRQSPIRWERTSTMARHF